MPAKYHIHIKRMPPRFRPIGKLGIIEWREDCSNCHNCVKKGCVYGFYRDELDVLHEEVGYLDYIYQCKGCLNCVQNCTKNILTRVVNPEYNRLGDSYFKPEIILSTWYQSETGSIPVSGAGYGGPFTGPGFDSMWTDMSEIVRPTRDGIHGREYINTSVDIGRKLNHLSFDNGKLNVETPTILECPIPLIFEQIPDHWQRGKVVESIVNAAASIGTFSVLDEKNQSKISDKVMNQVIPDLKNYTNIPEQSKLILIPDSKDITNIKNQYPDKIIAIKLKANKTISTQVINLAKNNVEVIYIKFDKHGYEFESDNPRHMRDVLRDVHNSLTKEGIRDEITIIVSGGIAMAEHMAKAIICGADLVAIDIPLVIALECRLCLECERGEKCPICLESIDQDYAIQRIINLVAAWRNQLLELLGAMGIREVRRLRGETGRCIFFEEIEKNTFAKIFSKKKD